MPGPNLSQGLAKQYGQDRGCNRPIDRPSIVVVETTEEWGSNGEAFYGMLQLPVPEKHQVFRQASADLWQVYGGGDAMLVIWAGSPIPQS